ncbi:hypothetical protein V492_06069 [Pseudogymnoascus sp. VKM F-4246]|nr:hypothetical protein V492_06069 [Pseudogymnoascus sp. VKM F-4246]
MRNRGDGKREASGQSPTKLEGASVVVNDAFATRREKRVSHAGTPFSVHRAETFRAFLNTCNGPRGSNPETADRSLELVRRGTVGAAADPAILANHRTL